MSPRLQTADSPPLTTLQERLRRVPWGSLARWWVVGVCFMVVGTGLLWIAKDALHMPLMMATTASAEVTLLIRFLVNDAWVFGHKRPTWKRLWQFHVASAGGFVIWSIVSNGLPPFGVNYLVASVVGSACSMGFSILTNFFWIWRRRAATAA